MKTIYTVKTLCVLAMFGTVATVSAQENKTDKDKNLNREMTLEREYDPSVQDANKVNTLPVIKEPVVRKIPIDYATFTIAADPAKEIGLLPSGNIMTQMDYNKRRGYFNFGIGTYMNINGDLGYHILNTEKDKLNIFYSHRSTNGKVKYLQIDEKVKAKLNDNLAGINFKHNFESLSLLLGAKYGYSGFNYYGLPMNNLQTTEIPDVKTNQVNQTIQFNAGVESKEDAPVGYLLDLGYTNFSHKYGLSKDFKGPKENTFDLKFDFNAGFGGNQKIGLGGNFEYFNYNLPTNEFNDYLFFENHAEGRLSPYYKVEGDNWNLKLGVNVMFVTGEDKKMMVSPDVAFDMEVADKTVLYAIATGKLHSNSMYEISRINRYVDPTTEISPSRNWLDATLGIKSGVINGFWFDVFAGYKITSEDVLFVPSRIFSNGEFGNYAEPMDMIDTKHFFIGANLKYAYQWLDMSLKGVYNSWKAKYGSDWEGVSGDLAHAWGKPEMEINAGVSVHPLKPLTVSLDYYLATGRYTELFGYDIVKMKNINELNLTGTYNINDTFGVYVKLNNILFQKYEVLYGYPLQSFSAMAGININF